MSESVAVEPRYFFRSQNRVLKRRDFLSAYADGKSIRRRAAHIFIQAREDSSLPTRLGITVTRKVGDSVRRNRLKRMAREVFRLALPQMRPGYTVIVNFHRAALEMGFERIQSQLHSAWSEAGIYGDESGGKDGVAG
jgi:ribonuclease P protein component